MSARVILYLTGFCNLIFCKLTRDGMSVAACWPQIWRIPSDISMRSRSMSSYSAGAALWSISKAKWLISAKMSKKSKNVSLNPVILRISCREFIF